MKKMPKIFKLEIPFYLLVIGLCMLDKGNTAIAIVLFLVSFFRLFTNSLNDEQRSIIQKSSNDSRIV